MNRLGPGARTGARWDLETDPLRGRGRKHHVGSTVRGAHYSRGSTRLPGSVVPGGHSTSEPPQEGWKNDLAPRDPLAAAQPIAPVGGDAIEPRATVDDVARAVACGDRVVAGAAPHLVAAGAGDQDVVAGVAVELVGLGTAQQAVVAAAAEEPVAPPPRPPQRLSSPPSPSRTSAPSPPHRQSLPSRPRSRSRPWRPNRRSPNVLPRSTSSSRPP